MSKYIAPNLDMNSFTCPYCNTLSQQVSDSGRAYFFKDKYDFNYFNPGGKHVKIEITTCQSCLNYHVWINGKMVIPNVTNIPMPLEDMPNDIKELYNEARDVFPHSKRATSCIIKISITEIMRSFR